MRYARFARYDREGRQYRQNAYYGFFVDWRQ